MALLSFDEFEKVFEKYGKYDEVKIRYTKQRGNEIIHKDVVISCENNKYEIKELERNQSTKKEYTIRNKENLTSESLEKEHCDIATLFKALDTPPAKKKTFYEDFKTSDSILKWLARNLLLDTRLIGGIVGQIIAYSANKENPHYKTIPSSILANTLGPLIFPGGHKKPIKEKAGVIIIDGILYKQYKSLRNYNPEYKRDENTIRFHEKEVGMNLGGSEIKLDTIVGSNKMVSNDEEDHLHVIYFNGNSGCYQQDYKMVAEDLIAYEAKNIKATAIQFNYPGVLNSEGQVSPAQDLIDAGIAQVTNLIEEGVPHDKIVLHGVSLGGSIASHVAAHFHKLPKSENHLEKQTLGGIYASRTFASTAQVGRDFFNRALGDNIISRTISTLCLPFIKLGTWGSEWDLDTGKAFFSLPRHKRDYSVVLSPKANRKEYRKKNRGGFVQQMTNFILRKRIAPADDEIL